MAIHTEIFDTPGVYSWTPPSDVNYALTSFTVTVQGAWGGDTAWRTDPVYGPLGDWPALVPGSTRQGILSIDPAETYEVSVGNVGQDGSDLWTGGDGGLAGDGSADGYDASDGDPSANPMTDLSFYYGGGGGGGATSHFGIPGDTPLLRASGANGGNPAVYNPSVPSSGKGGRGGGAWSPLGSGDIGGSDPGVDLPDSGHNGVVWIQWEVPDVFQAGWTIGRLVLGSRGSGF